MRQCPQCGGSYDDSIAFCPADGSRTRGHSSDSAADAFVGSVIDGRYRVEARVGEGGMGVVYRATHVALNKALALKVIKREQAADANVLERFLREARAASAIGHPNIVVINDFGFAPDGSAYLAMEYLDGETLASAMKRGPLPYDQALSIFVQIVGALEAAHAQGIVHRDLTPENIFLIHEGNEQTFVKVLDFGIAKVKNAAAKLTRTGLIFGTPSYISPEQAAGQPVDRRSDIYSLGVIMYQVLSGELPFQAQSQMALVTKHMFEPPASLRDSGCIVPSALDAIVLRCLQKKPELRHASMHELEADLRRVQVSPVSEPRPTAPEGRVDVGGAVAPTGGGDDSFVGTLRASDDTSTGRPSSRMGPFLSVASSASGLYSATSETLDAALLAHAVQTDEEVPISVPKQRPRWLWLAAAGVLLLLIVLSTQAPEQQRSSSTRDPEPAASVTPKPQLVDSPSSAPALPATDAELPDAEQAAVHRLEPTQTADGVLPLPTPAAPLAGAADSASKGAASVDLKMASHSHASRGGKASPNSSASSTTKPPASGKPGNAPAKGKAPSVPSTKPTAPAPSRNETLLDPWR